MRGADAGPEGRVVRRVEAGADEPAVVLEAGVGNGAASWQRVILAGHSLGGILVQLLAFRRPDLVAGLVLVDPGHEEMESLLPLPLRWGWRVVLTVRPDELHDDAPVTLAAVREMRAAAGTPCRRERHRP